MFYVKKHINNSMRMCTFNFSSFRRINKSVIYCHRVLIYGLDEMTTQTQNRINLYK